MSDILHGRKHPKVGARPGAAAGETAAAVASKKKGLQLMRDADRAQAGAVTSQAIASFADGSASDYEAYPFQAMGRSRFAVPAYSRYCLCLDDANARWGPSI